MGMSVSGSRRRREQGKVRLDRQRMFHLREHIPTIYRSIRWNPFKCVIASAASSGLSYTT